MTQHPSPSDPAGFTGSLVRDIVGCAAYSGASGILHARPSAVAVPEDADDLARLLAWATETGTAVTGRAAATGMPGGNLGNGVVVDLLSRFRRVPDIDSGARRARVEPGVTVAELNDACAGDGLRFPVDPSSGARCTLGGMIANNSAGAHSVRYGATRRWVESLDLVLPGGARGTVRRGTEPTGGELRRIAEVLRERLLPERAEILRRWPRVRKNSSGYALREYLESGDLVDLLVGSEGTLALVVAADVRLDRIPARRGVALLEFTSLARLGEAVPVVLEHDPSTCEMLDRTYLEMARLGGAATAYPLREGLEGILLVEMEGETDAEVEERLERLARATAALADRAGTAVDPEEQHRFWEIRHAASPTIARMAGARVSMQFIEDGVVPVERLPEYILALRGILSAHDVPAVIFGHAGDGNLHVNPLVDVRSDRWRGTLERILDEVTNVVASLGGTMAGEHGDGHLRAPLLARIWGEWMVERFRMVKEAFDPRGILNPGVILPLPGQRPFDRLRSYGAPLGPP